MNKVAKTDGIFTIKTKKNIMKKVGKNRMENIEKNELIVVGEDGVVTPSKKLDEYYENIQKIKDEFSNKDKELREGLIEGMIKHNIVSLKTDGYTFTLVRPQSSEKFDEDSFVEKEDFLLIDEFTVTKKESSLDLDSLLADNPELVEKYTKTTETNSLDVANLKKKLPEVYAKYVTIIPSTKEPTIRVTPKTKK